MKTLKTFLIGTLAALVGFTALAWSESANLTMCEGDVLNIYESHGSSSTYDLTVSSANANVVKAERAASSVTGDGKFYTVTAVKANSSAVKVTLSSKKSRTTNTITLNITVNAARTVKVNGTVSVSGWANSNEPGGSTWNSTVDPSGRVTVAIGSKSTTTAMTATLTGKTAGDAKVTIKNVSSNAGSEFIYKVKVTSDDASVLTRTVSADGNWTDESWTNKKTGAGGQAWKAGSDAEITVSGMVTLDVGTGAVSAGKVTIKGTGDLTLRNYQNLTASSIDTSALDGTITYLYVSDSANKSSGLQSKITNESDQKVKYGFAGTTAANGWNIGSWTSSTTLKTHLVLESGTHSITWSGNSATAAFAQNGTDENPTVLVRNGATLNFTAHDLSGYQSTFAEGGVIRVNAGGTLNFIENTSGSYHNFNYRQRLVLDPESLTTFKFRSGYLFTLHGAGATPGTTATAETANIYVPPSDGTKGPAILRRAADGVTGLCINHTGSSRGGGCAIYVGENSKLQLDADVQKGEESDSTSNKRILAKLGPGELEITGEVTSSVDFDARAGIITLPEGQGKFNKSFTATADVTYRFPAGWAEGAKYTLGSGTVAGTAPDEGTATVYVGTTKEEGCDLVYEGKTVRYGLNVPRTPIAVPTAAQNLVYGWTNQVGVAEGEGYVLTGVSVTNAVGTFSAFATPDDTHCWTDKSRTTKEITWSIAYRAATVTVIDTNKVAGAAEPIYRTRNENFIADDPTELVWTAWRTNTSEAVGTYDVIVLGETHQGGYEITYVGGTLEITPEPPPTFAITIANGEGIEDVQTNGVSVVGELELLAGTTTVELELVKDGALVIPVYKVITNDVTNVTQRVATYAVGKGLTYTFIAEEAEEADPAVTPTDTKNAIIDAIDLPNPDDPDDVERYVKAVDKVETVAGDGANQVPARELATWITDNGVSSADLAQSDYVVASVKFDTEKPITDENTEVEFTEVAAATSDGFVFDFDLKIDGDSQDLELAREYVAGCIQTTGDLSTDFAVIGDPKRVMIDPDTGKVTITPDPAKSAEFFKIVIPRDPGTK